MRFILLSVVFWIMLAIPLYAQEPQTVTVSGKVTEDGMGLPGVNVIIKGTSQGTTTDYEGNYNLKALPTDVLVFTFIGYQAQEVAVANRTAIDVEMVSDIMQLNEVVVVGYGEQKKSNLTGAVGSLDLSDIKNVPSANATSLLQGRMAGVTVSNFSTQPGEDNPEIRIRGVGTFNAGANPLIIVDGVQSQLGQIPVGDIESITVLKDAASASIYGVRAANGVVLITTKRGKAGVPEIQFGANVGLQQAQVDLDLVDSWDHARIVNLIRTEQGSDPLYTEEQIETMRNGSDPDHFANTDWWDQVYRTAPMQKYYVAVNGGSDNASYRLSGEVLDQKGIMLGTGAKRYSFRSNIDVKASKKLSLGLNLYGYKRTVEEPVSDASGWDDNGLNYSIRRFAIPTVPVKYSNGQWGAVDGVYDETKNIIRNVVQLANLGDNFTDFYRFEGKVFADWEILPNLHIKSSLSSIYNTYAKSVFSPTSETYDADGNVIATTAVNSLSNSNKTSNQYLIENLIRYNRTFQEAHNFALLLGSTQQLYRDDYTYAYIESFPNNEVHELDAGSKNADVAGDAREEALRSFFGRLNYDYKGKYLFEVNVRHDGTSRFPENNRWGTFPSFSAGWVITSEEFAANLPAVSFLKIRGSWGQLGNQDLGSNIVDYYPYSQTIDAGVRYIVGGNVQGGVAVTTLANSNISWETTQIADLGIDANFLQNRLQITADFYNKTTKDILMRLSIPYTLGNVTAPYQNVGEVKNTGWEVTADYVMQFGKVQVNVGGNLSHFHNEIVNMGGLDDQISGSSIYRVGEAIGAYYSYVADGYFQNQTEIDDHATQFNTLAPGDIRYKDISGADGVPDGQITDDDRKIIGSPFPDLTYGFNLGATYGAFDLSAFFQGITGIKRWQYYNNESVGTYTTAALDYWTPDNPSADYPRWGNGTNNAVTSSFWLKNASYLRLKNLQLGYTLPAQIGDNLGIRNLRVYFAGYNMLTFTKMVDYDPERASGDDRSRSYPQAKVYSLGVNVTF